MHNPDLSRHTPLENRKPISNHPHLQFPFPHNLLYHNDMNQIQTLMKTLKFILLSVFLILFMLLSLNSVLPLKWQFPAWRLSSHLETRIQDTAEGRRVDYINSRGVITVALDKNYSTVLKTLDQDGNYILERYLDNHGNPAVLASGYSALKREYDADGNRISQTYLDDKLNPCIIRYGYASTRRKYNSIGKIELEMFFDTDGLTAMDIYRKYGYRNEYNADGRVAAVICLDSDGNTMNNLDHYAIVKRTYYADGKLRTEMFYDQDGNPARLRSGQYGYLYVNGRPICLDKDGNKMFVLRYFLLHSIFAVLLIGILLLLLIILLNRGWTCLLLLLYLVFIAYMTVMDRKFDTAVVTWSIPPNIYLFFRDSFILSNIWLFVPIGAMLYKLSRMWEICAVPIFMSLVIETTQLFFIVGTFEISDLIANSLGGIVGISFCYLLEPVVGTLWKRIRSRLFHS